MTRWKHSTQKVDYIPVKGQVRLYNSILASMDFGTNSLWGSFSAEQAASADNSRIEENESDTEASNSNTNAATTDQPKWDINEFLGVHGEACSTGQGCECTECNMEFAFPGLLEVHKSKMHGITPLPSCKQCNMVFRRIMGLINHWRTGVPHVKDRNGTKLLGCDICDSFNIINGFRDKEEVAEHTKAVHGDVSITCTISFRSSSCCCRYRAAAAAAASIAGLTKMADARFIL